MLTIGIDARAAAEEAAGRGRYVRSLLAALGRRDDEAIQFTLYGREPWGDLDPSRFTWSLSGLPEGAWHAAVARRSNSVDDVFLSTNSYLTAVLRRGPTVSVVHDLVPYVLPRESRKSALIIERATLPLGLRSSRAAICVSESTRNDLVARFPASASKSVVIPLAAQPPLETGKETRLPGGLIAGNYVLSVGTIEPRKNLDRLVGAWQSIPAETRAGRVLALVGPSGWGRQEIGGADADVVALGRVSDSELWALYRNCSCFAYPALYEGFGLPPLEAMASGAPVVTSDSSSLSEVAGDAAVLVDPTSTASIQSGIEAVLSDPGLAKTLADRGIERASEFSWAATARSTLELLKNVSGRPDGPQT